MASSGQCDNYLQGVWTDYASHFLNRQRFLVKDSTAVILSSFLGVIITLAGTRLWVLCASALEWSIERSITSQRKKTTAPSSGQANIALHAMPVGAGTPHYNRSIAEDLLEYTHSRSDFGAFLRAARDVILSMIRQHWSSRKLLMTLGFSSICLALFFLVTLGGIFSSGVILDSTAICESTRCGLWMWDDYGYNTILTRKLRHEREKAAATHQERCYRDHQPVGNCDSILGKAISYEAFSNTSCPFQGDVCLLGSNGSFTMDTRWQDSEVLGINSPYAFYFRRQMTCAPLVVNSSYAEAINSDDATKETRYRYGRSGQGAWFESNDTARAPHPFAVSTFPYSGTYFMSLSAESWGFYPLPEFSSNLGRVSLLFILPVNVVYSFPSTDPVFLATGQFSQKVAWYWDSPFASVLGCVESADICDSKLQGCTSILDSSGDLLLDILATYLDANLDFVRFALIYRMLRAATVFNSISTRGGNSLNAQSLVDKTSGLSGALHQEQWKVEARQIFETSLSMAMVEGVGIANGVGADAPGADNLFEAFGDPETPYRMVKVNSIGHKSVSLWGVILILTGSFLVVLISIDSDDKFVVLNFLTDQFMNCARFIKKVATNAVGFAAKNVRKCKRRFQRWRRRPQVEEGSIFLE